MYFLSIPLAILTLPGLCLSVHEFGSFPLAHLKTDSYETQPNYLIIMLTQTQKLHTFGKKWNNINRDLFS